MISQQGVHQIIQLLGSAPALFAKKKDGTLRLCVSSKPQQDHSEKSVPDPTCNHLLDQLGSANIYTKLNLHPGYYNVHIAAGHKWNTAFQT